METSLQYTFYPFFSICSYDGNRNMCNVQLSSITFYEITYRLQTDRQTYTAKAKWWHFCVLVQTRKNISNFYKYIVSSFIIWVKGPVSIFSMANTIKKECDPVLSLRPLLV